MYYLRKEPQEKTIPEIAKTDGTVIPERKFMSDDRAIYKAKEFSRFYRGDFKGLDGRYQGMTVYTCKTLKRILELRTSTLDKVALTWPGSEMIIQWYDSLDDYYAGALSDCSERDSEVMQYTGLKDKNGREIYEGDLVYVPQWKNKYKVIFDDGMFKASGRAKFSLITIMGEVKCEVIGNIYENPELIEV